MELVIRNAKLRGQEGLVDISVEDGKFKEIRPNMEAKADREIDAGGNLVIPPLGDPHLHMDAVICAGSPRYNVSGTLLEGIQVWGERKAIHTKEMIKKNAIEAIKWEVAHGVLHIRGHVDATDPTLLGLEALLEVKEEMKDVVNLQISAFPQDAIFTNPDGARLMDRAMAMGADCVGGAPHLELTREDGVRDVVYAFDLAEKYGKLVDLHVDETADGDSHFVEVVAAQAILRGMQGLVSASHVTAMNNYNNDYAFKVIGNMKRAEMNVITCPCTNAAGENRLDGYPKGRALARVNELLERGVNVAIANDGIMNPWYLLGNGSMLLAANLLAHYGHMSGYSKIPDLFDMITTNNAKTFQIEDRYGIDAGKPADFVIIDTDNEIDAIRLLSECLYVVKNGKVLVETTPAQRRLTCGGQSELVDCKLNR